MRWLVAAVLLAVPVAATAQERQQFDLRCNGLEQLTPGGRKRPVERIYRIDLDRKVWCIEDCSVVLPIAEVTDTQIVFQLLERYGMETPHWVSRVSGEVREVGYHGSCARSDFTGIPARRF